MNKATMQYCISLDWSLLTDKEKLHYETMHMIE